MPGDRPNIALVVLDTLRKDHFDAYFDWVPGKRFSTAYSTSNWTIPAHASLFTGKYPSEVGTHSKSRDLTDWESSLPALLRDRGYRTSMYTANPNLSGVFGWGEGFDVTRGADEFDVSTEPNSIDWDETVSTFDPTAPGFYAELLKGLSGTVRTDRSMWQSLREGVNRVTQDFRDGGAEALTHALADAEFDTDGEFLFVNLMDSHVPYYPPAEYRTLDGGVETYNWEPFVDGISNLEEVRVGYRDCAQYLSKRFRESFEVLRREFEYVIVTSDHGEMLGEHGMVDHVYGLYPEVTHVPLVVYGDDVAEETVDETVSLLDVHATVLKLAGVDAESSGRSLLSALGARRYLTEFQGLPMGLADTFQSNGVGKAEVSKLDTPLFGFVSESGEYVYDTHDDGIRSETTVPSDDDREEQLRQFVAEADVQEVTEAERETVSVELREQLEVLGYA